MNVKERLNIKLNFFKEKGILDRSIGIYLFENYSHKHYNTVVQLDMWRSRLRITFISVGEDYRVLVEDINNKDHHEADCVSGEFYIEEDEIEGTFTSILKSYKIIEPK
jgi:hypothetical protein